MDNGGSSLKVKICEKVFGYCGNVPIESHRSHCGYNGSIMPEFKIEELDVCASIREPNKRADDSERYLNQRQNSPLDKFVDKDASKNRSSVIRCQVRDAGVHNEIHFIPKFDTILCISAAPSQLSMYHTQRLRVHVHRKHCTTVTHSPRLGRMRMHTKHRVCHHHLSQRREGADSSDG